MKKQPKPKTPCLYHETEDDCGICIRPAQTREALIYRLNAELARQRNRYRFPAIWDRDEAMAEGLRIKERLENVDI